MSFSFPQMCFMLYSWRDYVLPLIRGLWSFRVPFNRVKLDKLEILFWFVVASVLSVLLLQCWYTLFKQTHIDNHKIFHKTNCTISTIHKYCCHAPTVLFWLIFNKMLCISSIGFIYEESLTIHILTMLNIIYFYY